MDQQSASLAWSKHPSVPDRLAPASHAGNNGLDAKAPATVTLGSPISGTISPTNPSRTSQEWSRVLYNFLNQAVSPKPGRAATVEDWFPNHARSSEFWRSPSPVRKDIEARKHTASWAPGERRPTVPRRSVRGTGPAASTIVTAGRPEPQGWSQRDSPAPHRPGVMGALVFVQSTAYISRIVLDRAARYTPMAARDDNRRLSSFEEAAEHRLRAMPQLAVNSYIEAAGYPAGGFFGRSHC